MSRRLAGSVLWNVAGQFLPALVALLTVPPLIRGLGTERFGLLTIAWVVMGYFSLFDLGMGRATTGMVAALTAAGRETEVTHVVTSSLAAHMTVGIGAGLLLRVLAPILVAALTIPPSLAAEASDVFLLLSISVPVVVVTSSLRGVLEGLHRFDGVNIIRIAASVVNYVAPLVILRWTASLTVIVLAILAGRVLTLLAHAALVHPSVPLFRGEVRREHVRPMLGFGGWLTVSNTVAPATTALDRFAIANHLSMSAVTSYATPYEVVTRLYIASSSLMAVMFPIYSGMAAAGKTEELREASRASARALLLVTAAPVLLLVASADLLLSLWLGPELAASSRMAARALLAGVLINTVAQAPATLLQATGNAALVARRQIVCFALYVPAVWLAAERGIVWVAGVWALRVAVESMLFSSAEQQSHSRTGIDPAIVAAIVVAAIALAVPMLSVSLPVRFAIASSAAIAVTFGTWQGLLASSDREWTRRMLRAALGRFGARA